tara:strand:+ start:4416 stop:4709 length:294 start_codon:yes stop_codon:yes gene_type:complete
MNDPLDIPMTANDVQDMDPVMLAGMWEKVRENRAALIQQRDLLREAKNELLSELKDAADELGDERRINSKVEDELDRCIRALAKVALRSIEHGEKYQ